jgi:hypothetical protein
MKQLFTLVLGALGILTCGVSLHGQDALLHYPLREGSGLVAQDKGSLKLDLQIGTGLGWSVNGSGIGGQGVALGRVSDSEVFAHNLSVSGKMANLLSYTCTGWYKLSQVDEGGGVLIDLVPSEGRGLQVFFSSKTENNVKKQALVCATVPEGTTPFNGPGVRYSSWDTNCGTVSKWMFFAVTVNTLATNNQIVFYFGTETDPVKSSGGLYTLPPSEPVTDFVIGKIGEVWLGNNGGPLKQRPMALGTYLNDFRFYGSSTDQAGALPDTALEQIRQEALTKK